MNNPAVFRWCPVNSSIRDTNHHTITATAVPNPFVVFKPKKKKKTKQKTATQQTKYILLNVLYFDSTRFSLKKNYINYFFLVIISC